MEWKIFADRREAGRLLAEALAREARPDPLVLGVPRGGVVVAAEVARELRAPLDVVIARKLGAPDQPELAIGAVVGSDGIRLLDEPTIRHLGVSREYLDAETLRQQQEIARRMRFYRGERPFPGLEGRSVLVVDDGIATGYTMRAAVLGLRRLNPRQLIVAVPVAPSSTCEELAEIADEVVCLETPEPFYAVGAWYEEFDQTSDEEVIQLLDRFGVRSAA